MRLLVGVSVSVLCMHVRLCVCVHNASVVVRVCMIVRDGCVRAYCVLRLALVKSDAIAGVRWSWASRSIGG